MKAATKTQATSHTQTIIADLSASLIVVNKRLTSYYTAQPSEHTKMSNETAQTHDINVGDVLIGTKDVVLAKIHALSVE